MMTSSQERAIDKAIEFQIGLTLSIIVRTRKPMKDTRDLNQYGITPHQRVVLGLLLRQRGKRLTLVEAACFNRAIVVSLLNRMLVALEEEGGTLYLALTDEGQLASHRSLPLEIVLREIGPMGGKARTRK